MRQQRSSRTIESGLSLVDALIGLFSLSIVILSVFTVINQAFIFTKNNAERDQMVQITRSIMEEIKSKLLNYSGETAIQIAFVSDPKNQTEFTNQSTLCSSGSSYLCTPDPTATDNILDLIQLAQIKTADSACSPSNAYPAAKTIRIASKENPNSYYTVQIKAFKPEKNIQVTTNRLLETCKYIRKFEVVTTPIEGSIQSSVRLESYLPLPS